MMTRHFAELPLTPCRTHTPLSQCTFVRCLLGRIMQGGGVEGFRLPVARPVAERRCLRTRFAARRSTRTAAALIDIVEQPLPWPKPFVDSFLATYWQKKPLLVRSALPKFRGCLDSDDLAGLALEEEVESRIIVQHGAAAPTPWELRRGPFSEQDLTSLPETGYTLVVNAVDQAVPHVAETLLPLFAWLPSWRVDDVQVSYAPPGGSVGPHSDQYDVFLLQAQGRKEWRLSTDVGRYGPLVEGAFVEGLEVAILRDFVAEETLVAHPGDMLYLPPGVAHYGIALEEQQTYSIGFLAPTCRDLVLSYVAAAVEADQRASERWADGEWLKAASRPGELTADAIDHAVGIIASLPQSREDIAQWFGSHVSLPCRGSREPAALDEPPTWEWVVEQLEEAGELCRHESTRCVFLPSATLQPGRTGGTLFVDGQRFVVRSEAAARVAAEVADRRALEWGKLRALGVPVHLSADSDEAQVETAELMVALITAGFLFLPTDDEPEDVEDEGDARDVLVEL